MWILISKYPWESWKREEHELCGLVNSLHPRDKTLQLHLYYILNYLLQWTLLGYIQGYPIWAYNMLGLFINLNPMSLTNTLVDMHTYLF